jgi:hypothetical protein
MQTVTQFTLEVNGRKYDQIRQVKRHRFIHKIKMGEDLLKPRAA